MIKEKMKKYNFIFLIMSMIFLFLISLGSAQVVWETYGNDFTPLWNAQYQDYYGRFDAGLQNITIDKGYNTTAFIDLFPFQSLVSTFNISSPTVESFLIFPKGNYLQIYDENLILQQEINTGGSVLSQIDTLDFWQTSLNRDIAGIWEINSTDVAFRVYTYNSTSNSFNKTFEQNFSTIRRYGYAGVRHTGGTALMIIPHYFDGSNFIMNFTKINNTGIIHQAEINRSLCSYNEPLAWWDIDNDGKTEYLTYCPEEVIIFEEDGTIEFNYTKRTGTGVQIEDVRMYKPDASSIWKIAILEGQAYYSYPTHYANAYLTVLKPDGSLYWDKSWSGLTYGGQIGRLAITNDYNGDGYDDIYMAVFGVYYTTEYVINLHFRVLEGDDGGTIESQAWTNRNGWNNRATDGVGSLTIVDINNNGYEDFIWSFQDGFFFYDPNDDTILLEAGATTCGCPFHFTSCIPADINVDNYQEIICSGSGKTILFGSTYTNQNAEITAVAYDPSTAIQVNTSLFMTISATDPENDTIIYRARCEASGNWTAENNNATHGCFYGTIGSYENTVAVRDTFHSTWDTYTETIYVTQTGEVCDNDGSCESEQGETYINCPNDCPAPEIPVQETEGGIAIPTQLVNPENVQQGLLPEIYYGTLAFFSGVLSPIILLVFVIFFALIIITFGIIAKKIALKVANAGK